MRLNKTSSKVKISYPIALSPSSPTSPYPTLSLPTFVYQSPRIFDRIGIRRADDLHAPPGGRSGADVLQRHVDANALSHELKAEVVREGEPGRSLRRDHLIEGGGGGR